MAWPFISSVKNPLPISMLLTGFGLIWTCGPREEVNHVRSFQTDRQTNGGQIYEQMIRKPLVLMPLS